MQGDSIKAIMPPFQGGAKEETPKETKITKETLKQLFSKSKLNMKTQYSKELVVLMARGRFYQKVFESPHMKMFLDSIDENLVSLDRQGRKEMTDIIKREYQEPQIEESALSKIFK